MVKLIPPVGQFTRFVMNTLEEVKKIKGAKDMPEGRTIFHEVLRSDIPESEKAPRRILDEAIVRLTDYVFEACLLISG